jgi:heat-inducible transcriptional repressor
VEEPLDSENLLKLNMLLNTNLCGLPVENITLGLIEAIKKNAGIHTEIVSDVFDAAAEFVHAEEDLKIYTSGATNIFKYPELADHQRASELIGNFEEKQALSSIVQETLSGESETGIQVYIGDENPVAGMRDCSVVTATYELGDGMKGTVGIIGPKRMDYERAVNALQTIMQQLNKLGDTHLIAKNIIISTPEGACTDAFPYFIPAGQLNQWRRQLTEQYTNAR